MSRRSPTVLVLSVAAASALVLAACGEQTPGGVQAPTQEQAAELTVEDSADQDESSDADDPIVVQIGEQEFPTNMAIYRKYDQAKSGPLALQAPTGPAEPLGEGKRQGYVGGMIFWSPETGAQIVRGQILDTYLDGGGPDGPLGWPVGDETVEGDEVDGGTVEGGAIFSDFQRGQIRVENQAIRVIEQTG